VDVVFQGCAMFCFVATAFWGRTSLLFVVATFLGHMTTPSYGRGLLGPHVVLFVTAAFGAVHHFVCRCGVFRLRDNSGLSARPFRVAQWFVLSPRPFGPHIALSIIVAFFRSCAYSVG